MPSPRPRRHRVESLLRYALLRAPLLLLLASLCWPLSTPRAEGVPYRAPPVGLGLVSEAEYGGGPFTLTTRVVAVKGDDVLVETSILGKQQQSVYYRWLVAKEANGKHYRFDEAALAALWPLLPGKSVELPVEVSDGLNSHRFLLSARVVALEPLTVPAGTFDTALIHHTLTLDSRAAEVEAVTRTWLDVRQGIVLKTEVRLTINGQSQDTGFVAAEVRLP